MQENRSRVSGGYDTEEVERNKVPTAAGCMVLYILHGARAYKSNIKNNIEFIMFDAEETGLSSMYNMCICIHAFTKAELGQQGPQGIKRIHSAEIQQ